MRRAELVDVDLGQADVADLALVLQGQQLADLVLEREVLVDAVQLEQVDGVHAQPAQAQLAFLPQITGVAQRDPDVRPGAQQARLGRDHQAVVGMQRLVDDLLGEVRAVGVRGVDEIHPELDGAAQHPDAFVAVVGRAPHALRGKAHRPEAESVDGQISAEGERSRRPGNGFRVLCGHIFRPYSQNTAAHRGVAS